MRVLLIGEYYSDNLGDGVICKNVEKELHRRYSNLDITIVDLSYRSDYTKESLCVNFDHNTNKLKNLLKKENGIYEYVANFKRNFLKLKSFDHFFYGKYDAAIFAGGALFLPCFIMQISYLVKKCNFYNIPVLFNCCGFGKIKSKILVKKLKQALSNEIVQSISIRDHDEIAAKIIGPTFDKSYDAALLTKDNFILNKNKNKNNNVGLGVMYIEKDKKILLQFWTQLIEKLNSKNISWKIFCNGASEDYFFSKYILNKLGLNCDEYLLSCPRNPDDLVNDIASFNTIISFRLHSHIIATSFNIPCVAMVWDKKVYDFFSNLNIIDRCHSYYDYDLDCIVNQLSNNPISKDFIEKVEDMKKNSRDWLLTTTKVFLDGKVY